MKIVFATGNENKLKEIREILDDPGIETVSMKEAGITVDVSEDGTSFEENAFIKARAAAAALKNQGGRYRDAVVMADDSGLAVDYLNGAPGVYSSRFMGEDTSYRIKNAEIIRLLDGVPDDERTARFVCVIAAVFPDGSECTAEGVMEGIICREERGTGGFGYDPIFFLPDRGLTSAEISMEEKNALSHRGKALRSVRQLLRERENGEDTDCERHAREACES